MVAWHEVPGIRKKKEPVPKGRCDQVFARWSTKMVLACAKLRDGVESGSYTIILSLRDNRSPGGTNRNGDRSNFPVTGAKSASRFALFGTEQTETVRLLSSLSPPSDPLNESRSHLSNWDH